MAQDVFSKMAEEPWLLNEDGYLNADTDIKEIIYHPTLNVILICTNSGIVRVLDVNSGVVLQSSHLSAINQNEVTCRYIAGPDRILFSDGQALGVRSDYNGVLLLDSILQKVISDPTEEIKVELPLSEAIILKESLTSAGLAGIDHVINELTDVISNAQKHSKKGIKAQKWNTVCLRLPLSDLRSATVNSITDLLAKHQQTPELAVASAVQERMSELLGEPANASDRRAMASESKRRDTFSQWPHMDYKWALPEQMAQAGFYHQPNASGDDRAMCFTCTVCLVCWERTDEPWSEHERHSQNCPFVNGEYTQNIPLSVTYATGPAIDATYRGVNVKTIGTSTVTNMIPTANSDGLISVFDISGKIKRTHSFFVTQFDSHILERFTQEFGVLTDCEEGKYPAEKSISALTIVSAKQQNTVVASANNQTQIRPTIVCGLGIRCKSSKSRHASFSVESLNDQNKNDHAANIMEVSYSSPESSCLYLVVYDFMYCKEQDEADNKTDHKHLTTKEAKDTANNTTEENEKNVSEFMNHNGVDPIDMDISMSPNYLMKHLSSFYKTLIPGDSDEVFLAPTVPSTKTYSGPRFVPLDSSETDSSPATSYIINQDYIFMNGLQNFVDPFDKSISDHINELKSSKSSKKLNYSRAVQCFSLPDQYKNRRDLIISDIVTTQDGRHILVVLKSLANSKSVLLLYLLDFAYKMVKVDAKPVLVRELCAFEKPVEVSLLPAIEKLGKMTEHAARNDVEGNVVLVCADGAVRIVGLSTLRTICYAKLDSEKFVSAAYCNSLERLCASTEKGSLHFYALNDTDNESLEDHEEDDLFGLNLDCPSVSSAQQSDSPDTGDTTRYFQEPSEPIHLSDLKRLHALTSFEPLKAGYCAVVPPSWSEIQQAQRQRRHPQSLNIDCEQYTKTWRLQTDITTWDEHIFEITLPSPMSLGHVDVNFTLQSAALSPHVEVTLLRQNASGIGHKRDVKFSVDETVTIDILQWADNPVISQEYLRAHNADILAGPVNLASCLDLTDQSGVVTLTSPKLFKSRNRTLLLHLRVVYTKEEENNKNNVKGKRTDAKNGGGGGTAAVDKSTYTSSRKAEFYMGCDCIHELSITVYTSKHTDIPYERVHRNLMLESTPFVQSLILTAVADCTEDVQGFVLDILNWLASIRLTRNRSNYGEAPYHQVEFLNVVENNLPELLQKCLLTGGRSIAHRCAKLVTICCSGAKNISEQIGTNFDGCVLNTLLHNLESISCVKSAAGLQWLLNLLLSTTAKGQDHLLSALCVNLLTKVSDELDKRTNPYHLLLRSRYGLYGTPMEPELFDIDPPPYPKGSSTSITYASVVSGDSPITNSNFYANYSFYKESISPKEVLSVSENKMKCKNVTPAKIFKGLIETEPLHFHCVSASEGTRLDRADDASSLVSSIVVNNMPADIHSSYISSSTKKEEVQHFWSNVVEIVSQVKNSKTANSTISEKLVSTLKNPLNSLLSEEVLLDNNPIQLLSDAFRNKVENKSNSSKSVWQTEDILSPENQSANLWQHLFVTPPQQVIVVERMHSGARRFVTLDFGQPVILTDVLIPSCIDLVSISIDVWLKSEDADPVRLVVASDIGTRNLILNDLQPLTVCRYMKITAVGRYGMSTTRCRIPIGYFYGHMILLPDQIPHEIQDNVSAATYAELDKHLINLAKLFEDIGCRYSLSCSKLKEALQGFIVADVKNASHLLSYMNIMKDKNSNVSTEHNKIFQAYREAITYQRQLNTVRHIMNRVENSPNTSHFELIPQKDFSNVSTDKLRSIAEGLLEVLLSLEFTNDIQLPVCQKLFHGLCVSQSPRLQFLAAIFLKNSSGKKNYWGNFLSDTLAEMFSTSYTLNFPQDRVFILIAYLSKRSPQRSSVIDAALRVIYQCLSPLNQQRRTLLAISVDLPLLSWLLMYLSLQLDLNKNSAKSIARWDWVFGEMVGRATVESTRSRLAKVFKPSLSQNVDNKMPSIKGPKLFMKMYSVTPGHLELHGNENAAKKPKKTSETSPEKNSPKRMPLYVDAKHCLAVAKGLLNLVLSMDHSSSADMLLLSFKVIARLSMLVKLRLGQLMNEDQLLKLIYFCLASKIPWAPHALACLLEDIMDLSAPPPREDLEMETDTSASTSWATGDYDNENVNLEDNLLISALPTPCKTSSTPKNNQLASVYEYDDSELEELMEDFLDKEQSTKKHPPKSSSTASSLNSCAVDSRLDAGVEIFPEIALRKLIGNNTQTLVQNITAGAYCAEREEGLTAWSSAVLPFQQESPMTNHKMLKHCFQELFENLQVQSPASIEHVLQLWLTLSGATRGDKFDPSTSPSVALNCEGIRALIGTLAWAPGLTLVTWCVALQTLTLACNTLTMSTISTQRLHWGEMMGLATVIVDHPDFVQFLLRLLSGTGVVSSEKGLAGPSLCKALHDLLVRLQMRCDIVSPCSKMGGNLKTLLLKVVYQLVQPSGPIACRQGPLDAQCKIVQSMLHIDFCNADLGIAMSILESTGTLVHTYVTNADRVKCNNSGDFSNATFRHLYSTVLGADPNKQDRPVSSEVLLITLLKLLGKLVKTPFPNDTDSLEAMDTEPPATTSQTDESKAEQIQQDSARNPQVPCLADIALQHHPSIIRLCSSLAACKTSSLCMLACLSQKHAFVSNFSEPNTIADGVFHILISLAKNASKKDLLMQPLLMFLSQTPQLSEPLLWFILQVLDTGDTIRSFMNAGGIGILGRSFVTSSNTPSTISKMGTISTVMQYFNKTNRPSECNLPSTASTSKKSPMDDQLENRLSLVNFAPCSTIRCNSTTAQPAEVLILGGTTTHRRARTPQWSYHFYPEEVYTELVLQLPSAILLKQVHLQPHLIALSTCPSAVGLEVSANGPSRLVPVCPPIATSGMSYIQLDLPVPEVVNCVLIRLYKPRTANNISLSQIRLLGFPAFTGKVPVSFMIDDELHCKHSLGWLRLLHHCFTLPANEELVSSIVACCAQVPNLLTTACGLLLVPSHILPDYLPCLEKVLRELSLHNLDSGIITMRVLLESRCSSIELLNASENMWQDRLLVNTNGYQSACELLYQICEHQDGDTCYRVSMILEWLQTVARQALATENIYECNPAYISCVASILWYANRDNITYNLKALITSSFYDSIYKLKVNVEGNTTLKYSLDSLLCSICYIKPEFYPMLLQNIGILVPNSSGDRGASISDDRKDHESMTDDIKETFGLESNWYSHLVVDELCQLNLSNEQLETLALVSRSPSSIKQLLDSGLTKILNDAILEFATNDDNVVPMAKLENVTAILKFFTDVCEEKPMRDWLGSTDGSSFWLHLLHWLCRKTTTKKYNLQSETHAQLEEMCIRFLSKCCLCHPMNQNRLAKVLCEVISLQSNGVTGFMRRLILQLLLENEKIPVSITADETLYKSVRTPQVYLPSHPAFKQTYKRALLYLSTSTTLSDILEEHIYFNPHKLENTTISKKPQNGGGMRKDAFKGLFTEDSDLSVAAGVLAKDKRAKDNKNLMNSLVSNNTTTTTTSSSTPVKKKRYTSDFAAPELIGGRLIKCESYSDQSLPLSLNLGQLLKLIESNRMTTDWPCVHLTVSPGKGSDDKSTCNSSSSSTSSSEVSCSLTQQQPYSSALQVFSAMGGLALLAQHLPTVYPETVRPQPTEKINPEPSDSEWIKVEDCDDIYEEETVGSSSPSKTTGIVPNVPPHSLTAFGLFLRLPGYAEILLKDMKEALCLLRLVLGVTDDGEGGDIFQLPVANSLPTLPFEVLRKVYDTTRLNTDDGRLLRRISINSGVVHLLLACLGIFTHQTPNSEKDGSKDGKSKEERSQLYWAKGTGFGTGSTQQSWNVEQALLKQRSEEEHVTVLLQVLASYINPNGEASDELAEDVLPPSFYDLLANSSLLPALSSYLRNDSVLDMARHIPLYKAALQLLRALAVSSQLVGLLLPQKSRMSEPSICSLLKNMKNCVDTYASKLRINSKTESKMKSKLGEQQLEEVEQGEGLATLMPDIQDTANLVSGVTNGMIDSDHDSDIENMLDRSMAASLEERYLKIMKNLQFASYEMITDLKEGGVKFVISHHFESNAKSTSEQSHPSRVKRIAQEAVTLSSSLPLSYSSSVFVRYDTSRLDVMKVLITGPSDTPYANGCFELDVFFPQDYPTSPMMINLETTGHHSVRFNPNLYNDGKVCLSVLNTWHGRPEEKWNAQTSSFLQVLVSIQSLILVPEPYFNEPGYERSRGTPAGSQSSKEYNATICQATVRWAMLEQMLNPCPCFKDIILTHFYLKRYEIIEQVDGWVKDLENDTSEKRPSRSNKRSPTNNLENFKKVVQQLKDQLLKMKTPVSLDDEECETSTTPTNSIEVTVDTPITELENEHAELDTDIEMEKMVNEMCE